MPDESPITPFLERQGFLILDGGLATELEARGYDLNHPLWSAHLLLKDPKAIRDLHLDYLHAGADCIISSSYQASIPGFLARGISKDGGRSLLKKSVELAREARDEFCERSHDQISLPPLVAASVGPYGAFLADGSEYVGRYEISREALSSFHAERWGILLDSRADLLACETIPSFTEASVLVELLNESPDVPAWVSFSCRDGERISDGTPISECAALLNECRNVIAVGVNCTSPAYVSSLIKHVHDGVGGKAIVVYPNSGEEYDPVSKAWQGNRGAQDLGKIAVEWFNYGARLIGGCCRTGPKHIFAMKENLKKTR